VANVTLPLLNTGNNSEVSTSNGTSRVEKDAKKDPESKGHIGHIGHNSLITLEILQALYQSKVSLRLLLTNTVWDTAKPPQTFTSLVTEQTMKELPVP